MRVFFGVQNRTVPPASTPRLLTDLLDNAVARFPDRAAMDFLGRRWRYRELGRLVDHATRGLQDLGVGPGTAVGLCLPNTPYYIVCYCAVLRAGGIVVNFNPLYVERELLQQIRDSGATVMVTLDLEAVYRQVANVADQGGLRAPGGVPDGGHFAGGQGGAVHPTKAARARCGAVGWAARALCRPGA